MKLREQFFDFEVLQNWWCCVIGEYPENDEIVPESLKDDFIVITSETNDAYKKLFDIICNKNYVNFGYNNKRYDNIILNGIFNGFTPRQLKILSDIIINPELQYKSQEHLRISSFAKRGYRNFIYQDMLDDNTGSLKEKEACMQLDIRESNVPFDKEDLTEEDKLDIISYCKHDVWAGMQFYRQVLKPFIATKLLVGKIFNLPPELCYKSTNATLSGHVLGAKKTSFLDATRQDFVIPKELRSYIKYSLPSNIVSKLCLSSEKFDVKLFGNVVSYSDGGIHSVPILPAYYNSYLNGEIISTKLVKKVQVKNLEVKSNNDWKLINVDAASFYPAMMIHYKLLSRAVSRPELFKEMYETRLRFKAEGDNSQEAKDISQAYKLILNTTYGASGNKYLALYDPYMTTCTCRLGQLLLTSLANNIYNQIGKDKVQIVQTNTDGILCYIHKDAIDTLHLIGDEWTRITKILLEYEEEEIIWQRDVNNYILYKTSGKEKSKGGFFVTDMIQPGYNRVRPLNAYVCRDAIKHYLKTGKDIVEHIYNETDISKFVVTCHKGSFSGIVRSFNDGRPDEVLHKVNRTYASNNKNYGMIYKTKNIQGITKKYKAPGCPEHCALINEDLSKYTIEDIRNDLDYMWYISNTIDLLSEQWYKMEADKIIPIEIYKD